MKYAALFLVLLVMGSEAGAKSALEDAKLKSMAINHPANGSPSTYRNDAEELKSVGAYYQNAAGAYARGYSGKIYNRSSDGTYLGTSGGRVIVAVVDSGVDVNHADLAANVLKTKAVKCTISAGCTAHTTDSTGHGTNSAGMIGAIKNGIGMHGVAFGSYILPVAALISGGSDILAFNYSLDQGAKVINASYGLEGRAGEIPIVTANTGNRDSAATSTQIQAYLAATERGVSLNNIIDKVLAKDAIVVFASGNAGMDQVGMLAGLPYYFRGNLASKPSGYTTVNPLNKDLSKNWVAAGAVNVTVSSGGALSYSIASYSNRCGVAKDWCLVAPFAAAPGYIDKVIYTTKAGGGYKYNMGTSFAAPSVSGAIAILKGAFPHLKSKDIMNVLYNTATDIGAVGVDTVYGRGMINLDKATNPSDAKWKITLANSYTLLNVSFSASGLNLSSAFGNALSKVAKEEIMFLDEYDKNYHIKLGALLGQSSTNRVAADQILAEFGEGELSNRVNFGDIEMGFAKTSNDYENIGRIDDPTSDLDNDFKAAFSSTTISSSKASATNKFTHNLNLANELSPAVLSTEINNQFSHSKAFKNPYLGFAESVDSGTFEYQKDGLGFKSGAFFGEAGNDRFEFNNDKSIKGTFSEVSYSKKGSGVALGVGVNIEDNSFLGAESDGALNLGDSAKTFYASVGGKYKVTSRLALLGSYNMGVTKLDAANNSLFKNTNEIMTDSFSFGGEYNGIVNKDDSLLLSVTQPLRVRSGSANLALPTSINEDGMVGYTNRKLDLSPEGREINLEAYYKTPLDDSDAELKFGSVYRINPDHYKNAENEGLFLAKFKQSF